jgi:predicted lactoylglutathione lyase
MFQDLAKLVLLVTETFFYILLQRASFDAVPKEYKADTKRKSTTVGCPQIF